MTRKQIERNKIYLLCTGYQVFHHWFVLKQLLYHKNLKRIMVVTTKVSKPKNIQTWVKPTKSISSKWITDQKFILSKLDSTCLVSLLIWAPSMNWKCLVFPTLIRTSWTEVLISSIFISNSFSVSSLFNLMFSHSSESEKGNYDFCNRFYLFLRW